MSASQIDEVVQHNAAGQSLEKIGKRLGLTHQPCSKSCGCAECRCGILMDESTDDVNPCNPAHR